ncbi:MAG: hypothetical protein GXC73_11635, partial [Chitinophagaceae bacterium]|nr:hypothetical protein [Chitinophagaceae bacterium]
NIAVRHILNSFGYDLGLDVFLETGKQKWLIGLHSYKNKHRLLPGIEVENPSVPLGRKSKFQPLEARAMLWLQPKDQLYADEKAKAGGLLQVRGLYRAGKQLLLFAEAEAKTDGWVAGNPYLDANLTVRMGVRLNTGLQ